MRSLFSGAMCCRCAVAISWLCGVAGALAQEEQAGDTLRRAQLRVLTIGIKEGGDSEGVARAVDRYVMGGLPRTAFSRDVLVRVALQDTAERIMKGPPEARPPTWAF